MKIKIAQICIILFICFKAQSQTWQWARTEPGTGTAEGWAVCSDPSGNAFLAGFTTGSFVIGTYTVSQTPGITYGIPFLVKYDPNGNILWVRSLPTQLSSLGPVSQSEGKSVYADNAGNVFMCGYFTGVMTVGPNSITSAGGLDAFLIKYDPNGNVLWLRSVGGSAITDIAHSVSTDAMGNSLITGEFNSPSMTVGNFTLINTSVAQYFLVKYDPNGNVLWAVTQQSGMARTSYVCTDANNNVFITGQHQAAVTIGQYTLPITGQANFFVAKYDPSGTVQWAATSGGNLAARSDCVNADPSGNVYVTGLFNGSFVVGSYALAAFGSNSYDVFIVKYDNNGNVLWAKREGGAGFDEGYSLASYSGGFFLAGSVGMSQTVTGALAGFMIGNNFINPTPAGPNSVGQYEAGLFLARYDAAGNPLYSTALNGAGDDRVGICLDKFCNLYLAADLMNTPLTIGTMTLVNQANESPLMAKMNLPPSFTGTVTLSVSGNFTVCSGESTTLTASGANSYTWNGNMPGNSIMVTPTVTSNYVVTGSSSNGCAANTLTQTVFVNPPPPVSIAATNTLICAGQTVTLTAQGANSYTWNGGSQLPAITVSPANNISYTVTGTNLASGCFATAALQLSVAICESIRKQESPTVQLQVYPNPNHGDFIVELNNSRANCEMVMVNSMGAIVHKQIVKPGINHIKTNGLVGGSYNLLLPAINKSRSFGQILVE